MKKFKTKKIRQAEIEEIKRELEKLGKEEERARDLFYDAEKRTPTDAEQAPKMMSISAYVAGIAEQKTELYARLDELTKENERPVLVTVIKVVGSVIVTVLGIILTAFVENVLGKLVRKKPDWIDRV